MNLVARTLSAAVLSAVLPALATTSAEATHTRGKCKQRGTTIAKSDTARVFEREQTLYACLWSQNRAEAIDTAYDDDYVTSYSWYGVRLAGRYVAWSSRHTDISCKADCPPGYEETTYRVNVIDLRTQDEQSVVGVPAGTTLRVTARGAVAWLERIGGGQREVHAWYGGLERVLDTGPIKTSSYSVLGDRLRWVNGDVQHSVVLR
jgi:hypothetical protein